MTTFDLESLSLMPTASETHRRRRLFHFGLRRLSVGAYVRKLRCQPLGECEATTWFQNASAAAHSSPSVIHANVTRDTINPSNLLHTRFYFATRRNKQRLASTVDNEAHFQKVDLDLNYNMDFSIQMFRDIPKVVSQHWKDGTLNWPMGIYITLVHIVATVGLFSIQKCSRETLLFAFILWPIRCVS
jgi:hypothetical protein